MFKTFSVCKIIRRSWDKKKIVKRKSWGCAQLPKINNFPVDIDKLNNWKSKSKKSNKDIFLL